MRVVNDLLAVTGLGLFVYGLHLVYPPAAFMAAGLALMSLGVLSALGAARAQGKAP